MDECVGACLCVLSCVCELACMCALAFVHARVHAVMCFRGVAGEAPNGWRPGLF